MLPVIVALAALLSSPVASFDANASETIGRAEQAVIYGEDGRQDPYTLSSRDPFRVLTDQATVGLIRAYNVDFTGDDATLATGIYGTSQNLCTSERFYSQPVGTFCSGTLIAPDLVMTAGHCFTAGQDACPYVRIVFNFQMRNASSLADIDEEDVYACTRVIAQELDSGSVSSSPKDWAIIQLDRPVEGSLVPAIVADERSALTRGEELVMLGAPSGLPFKVTDGASVRDNRSQSLDYFVANTDSYAGNSGSGVYRQDTEEVVGILVSGETDFESNGSCMVSAQCADDGCAGENIMYAFRAIDDFCEAGTNEELCGTQPVCGDGFCAYNENGCVTDCPAPVCGDGICGADEWDSCRRDCELDVPSGWTCAASRYADFSECNTNCGVEDPDCSFDSVATGANLGDLGSLFNCSTGGAPMTPAGALFGGMLVLALVRHRRRD